jgi:hypothetical protein
MPKRLVKFRGTNDYARVEGRSAPPAQPKYKYDSKSRTWILTNPTMPNTDTGGVVWASCYPSQFTLNVGAREVGAPLQPWTIQNRSFKSPDIKSPFGQGIQKGNQMIGPLFMSGGTTRFVYLSRPCTPANAAAVQESAAEPTFTEFQQQYLAYLAGRSKNAQNAKPLEMQ